MKNLSWILLNGTLISLFVLGNIGAISVGYLHIAVFGYWAFSLLGTMYFSNTVAVKLYEKDKNWGRVLNSTIDGLFDIMVVSIMVYFGYNFLPIFYIISYFGLNVLEENYNKIKKEDNERV